MLNVIEVVAVQVAPLRMAEATAYRRFGWMTGISTCGSGSIFLRGDVE
jgi:hypothetical protein